VFQRLKNPSYTTVHFNSLFQACVAVSWLIHFILVTSGSDPNWAQYGSGSESSIIGHEDPDSHSGFFLTKWKEIFFHFSHKLPWSPWSRTFRLKWKPSGLDQNSRCSFQLEISDFSSLDVILISWIRIPYSQYGSIWIWTRGGKGWGGRVLQRERGMLALSVLVSFWIISTCMPLREQIDYSIYS